MRGVCPMLSVAVLVDIGCATAQNKNGGKPDPFYVSINGGDTFTQKVKRAGYDFQPRKVCLT